MKCLKLFLLFLLTILFLVQNIYSCTTFYFTNNGKIVFGKNYDHDVDMGFVIINKRELKKTAFIAPPEAPVTWTSKYGSISFNQITKEFPHGGMNEEGLVIELMWLSETEYPDIDERPAVMDLQWIQYHLDNSRTVKEVIESDKEIRITPASQSSIHFLIGDREGNAAVIEFLDGKFVYYTGESLPVYVLANNTYAYSLNLIKKFSGFGGDHEIPGDYTSHHRVARAAEKMRNFIDKKKPDIINYSFDILSNVGLEGFTVWSIVYDIAESKIYYRTERNDKIREISLDNFDFNCDSDNLIINIDDDIKSIESSFIEYSKSFNRRWVKKVFNSTDFLRNVPQEIVKGLIPYPDSVECE